MPSTRLGAGRAITAAVVACAVWLVGVAFATPPAMPIAVHRDPAHAAQPPPPPPAGWEVAFLDDFGGDIVNASSWNVYDNQPVNGDTLYVSDGVSVQGGMLRLRTWRRNQTWNGTAFTYASGALDTRGKVSQHTGRFEVRAQLPTGLGVWPAHWLMPDSDVCWPCGGEIDILELFDKTGSMPWNSTVFGTYHWAEPGQCGKDRWQGDNGHYPTEAPDPSINFAAGFHVFAVEWAPDSVTWFVDDVAYHQRFQGRPPDLRLPSEPMYMILNTALAGPSSGWGPTAATKLPVEHTIDYVRIMRKATDTATEADIEDSHTTGTAPDSAAELGSPPELQRRGDPPAAAATGATAALYPLDAVAADYDTEVALLALQGLANRDAPQGPTLWLNATDKFWPYPPAGDEWTRYLTQKRGVTFQHVQVTDKGAPLCDVLGVASVKAAAALAGVILYNSSQDGARFVAVTRAGIDRALPLTPELLAAHAGCLGGLPVIANVTFEDDSAAYDHMLAELVPKANHSAAVAACHPHAGYACGWGDPVGVLSIDYGVAAGAITFNLSPDPGVPEQSSRFAKLVGTLDPLAPVLGWAEPEVDYAALVGNSGGVVLCGAPNLSFLRRVGSVGSGSGSSCHLPSSPGTAPLDRSKLYVTFQTNEGDTAKNAYSLRGGNWMSPRRGTVPMSWGVDPLLASLFPAMWDYQCDTASAGGNDTFFAAVAGAGYTHVFSMPDELRHSYETRAGELLNAFGPQGIDVWVSWKGNETMAAFEEYKARVADVGAVVTAFTMQPTLPTSAPVNMWLRDGTPVIAAAKALWYPQLNKTDPAADLQARILAAAAQAAPPAFLLVYGAPDYVNLADEMRTALPGSFEIVNQDEMARLARAAAPGSSR